MGHLSNNCVDAPANKGKLSVGCNFGKTIISIRTMI